MDKNTAKEIKEIKKQLGALARRLGITSSGGGSVGLHSGTHESGGTDALDGTHGIEAIKLVSGNRFYKKNAAGTNIYSVDEQGNLRLKGSVYENQSSV